MIVGSAFIVSVPVHDDQRAVVGLVVAPMVDFLLATEVDFSITDSVSWVINSDAAVSEPRKPCGRLSSSFPALPGIWW